VLTNDIEATSASSPHTVPYIIKSPSLHVPSTILCVNMFNVFYMFICSFVSVFAFVLSFYASHAYDILAVLCPFATL